MDKMLLKVLLSQTYGTRFKPGAPKPLITVTDWLDGVNYALSYFELHFTEGLTIETGAQFSKIATADKLQRKVAYVEGYKDAVDTLDKINGADTTVLKHNIPEL